MSVSRGIHLFRTISNLKKNTLYGHLIQQSRNSGGGLGPSYRSAGYPATGYAKYAGETMMAFFWWWVLWHLWTEPGAIFGEFPFPNPKKWTDEELGIPPDYEGPYEK